jgi:hypothetical protein
MSIDMISMWHQRARPEPTDKDFNVQLGCHFEEFKEMLDCLALDGSATEWHELKVMVDVVATGLKRGWVTATITDRKGFLDSLADQIVTGTGTGHCATMHVVEAVRRVNSSNWSKFDADGQPIRDANGKIAKGPTYEPPNLEGLY